MIHGRLIPQRLVRPFLVVMLDGFRLQMIHVLLVVHEDADSAAHVAAEGLYGELRRNVAITVISCKKSLQFATDCKMRWSA